MMTLPEILHAIWSFPNATNAAAWVQAVGSIAAVVGAAWIAGRQARREERRRAQDRMERISGQAELFTYTLARLEAVEHEAAAALLAGNMTRELRLIGLCQDLQATTHLVAPAFKAVVKQNDVRGAVQIECLVALRALSTLRNNLRTYLGGISTTRANDGSQLTEAAFLVDVREAAAAISAARQRAFPEV